MKEQLLDLLGNRGDLSWETIILTIIFSMIMGAVIFLSYAISHQGTIYSKKFNVSLVVLTVLTAAVMTVIGNNIALSLGMVGALSIVRFRTAVKDSRDTVYIFWTIIVGICCGVQDFKVAAIGSAGVFLILLLFGNIKNDSRMLLIIRGGRHTEYGIESLVYKLFQHKAILRVKNTTDDSVELIFETSDTLLNSVMKEHPELTNEFYSIGEIEYFNIVRQNDDISN